MIAHLGMEFDLDGEQITTEEKADLEKYLRVGQFIDLMQAKARQSLKASDGERRLPAAVAEVDCGAVPEQQLGRFDVGVIGRATSLTALKGPLESSTSPSP